MPYKVKCSESICGKERIATNIVDLITNYRDKNGWFICKDCGGKGYIEKSFSLQEENGVWEPFLKGIITLGDKGDPYQPFVFNVSNSPKDKTNAIWFSYYKDLRDVGGRLKLGYGPGGPPVLHKDTLLELIKVLLELEVLTKEEILNTISI